MAYFHKPLCDILVKDVISDIFSYDNSYRLKYGKILKDTFDNDNIRALKWFMENDDTEDEDSDFIGMMFSDWISIKSFTYENEEYYEVQYPTSKVLFHVMKVERKAKLEDLTDPTSPKIVKNILWKIPLAFLRAFVNCKLRTLRKMKREITNIDEYNERISCMLHVKDYEDLVYHLQIHGDYDEELHEYLFKELVRDRIGHKMYANDVQTSNYCYMTHQDTQYMIMWYEY